MARTLHADANAPVPRRVTATFSCDALSGASHDLWLEDGRCPATLTFESRGDPDAEARAHGWLAGPERVLCARCKAQRRG